MDTQKSIINLAAGTGFILLIPLVAMQFTDEVDWNLFDFFVIGTLLFGSGLVYIAIARNIKDPLYRAILATVFVGLVFLAWAELAVGIFGTPFAGS